MPLRRPSGAVLLSAYTIILDTARSGTQTSFGIVLVYFIRQLGRWCYQIWLSVLSDVNLVLLYLWYFCMQISKSQGLFSDYLQYDISFYASPRFIRGSLVWSAIYYYVACCLSLFDKLLVRCVSS